MPNRRTITIDIETLPALEGTEIPLTEKEKSDEQKALDAFRKTSLNGDFGRVLCIGYSDERADGTRKMGILGWDRESRSLHVDEQQMLKQFWALMRGFDPRNDRLVGHNIFDFDLRFLLKRSIINRVRPTVELSFARYRSKPIFDTMCEWDCWNLTSKISLDKLASALSLPTSKSDEVNGSRIFELFNEGRHREIRDYCLQDVRLTRQIYKMMTFTTDEELAYQGQTVSGSMSLAK